MGATARPVVKVPLVARAVRVAARQARVVERVGPLAPAEVAAKCAAALVALPA